MAIKNNVRISPARLPNPVYIRPKNDGAERPHQVARAEGSQRQHQRCVSVAGRENFARDVRRVVRVHHEVVHLQKIVHWRRE